MSDENTSEPTPAVVINYGAFTEGLYNGFRFAYPEFNDVSAAVEKYGTENVLKMLNTALANAVRAKVKNSSSLPKFPNESAPEAQAYLAKLKNDFPDGIVFTEANLETWRPFERDLSEAGLMKAIKEAVTKGNKPEALRLKGLLLAKLSSIGE